jgi:hypothetical protein
MSGPTVKVNLGGLLEALWPVGIQFHFFFLFFFFLESSFYFVSCLRHMVEIKLATSLYVFVVFYNVCWDRAYSRTLQDRDEAAAKRNNPQVCICGQSL